MSHSSTEPKPAHRFAVIGGDGRMTHLAERLTEEGYPVSLLGCGGDCLPLHQGAGDLRVCTTLAKAIENATALILPLPATRDGMTVSTPRDPSCRVTLDEIMALWEKHPTMILFGGKLPQSLKEGKSHPVLDYYDFPVLQLRNAYITAEAAMMTAMELTDRTLRGTPVAVLGYGRIGKYLARLLRAVGAEVTVCARRQESLFEAASEGCRPLLISNDPTRNQLTALSQGYPVLFNTVPVHLLSLSILERLDRECLFIDLASAPFGISDEDVRAVTAKNGLRYLRAPSLPGSYAPRDAGRIIAECILQAVADMDSEQTQQGKEGAPL